jgi:hypothetical protein
VRVTTTHPDAKEHGAKESKNMNAQDGRAMFELQLELHTRAVGRRPSITADDVLEVHELLVTHEGDLKSLFPPLA